MARSTRARASGSLSTSANRDPQPRRVTRSAKKPQELSANGRHGTRSRGSKRSREVETLVAQNPTVEAAGVRPGRTRRGRPIQSEASLDVNPEWLVPALQPCWPSIFEYAASTATGVDGPWLVALATVCRQFAEPALAVLYQSPKLATDSKMRKLLDTISLSIDARSFTPYHTKIRSLYIGPHYQPAWNRILPLIRSAPLLQHLTFSVEADEPPYRGFDAPSRRFYPPELWQVLDDRASEQTSSYGTHNIQSWRWSARLLGSTSLDTMAHLHREGSLRFLRNLHLVGFRTFSGHQKIMPPPQGEVGEISLAARDKSIAQNLAHAVSDLEYIRHLTVSASPIVEHAFLSNIPSRLRSLALISCPNVNSENLSDFLLTKGAGLQSLTLNHNPALNLSFLAVLGDACPTLTELRMNMVYFRSQYDSSSGAPGEPLFEHLLTETDVPTWPKMIERIEIAPMPLVPSFTKDIAAMFLQSIVDSAPRLPMLRHLIIKAMIDLPWKERAEMRFEWQRELERVFLRESKSPEPYYSIRQHVIPTVDMSSLATASMAPPRRSSRLNNQGSTSNSRASSVSGRMSYTEPSSDVEEFEDVAEGKRASKRRGGSFIQGQCLEVELSLENHIVQEIQFTADDFMDEDDEEGDDSDYSN